MKTFKTLAEFKKILEVGDKLKAFHHGNSLCPAKDMGIREVSIKQTNSFALATVLVGATKDSWCEFPKASNVVIEDNKLTILHPETKQPQLTYEFV